MKLSDIERATVGREPEEKNYSGGVIFNDGRSSPTSKVAKAPRNEAMGTSVRSLNLLLKKQWKKFKQEDPPYLHH